MTKKIMYTLALLVLSVAACGPAGPATTAVATESPVVETPTQLPMETPTPEPNPTSTYPPDGLGPTNFPAGVDPLTGLQVADPALLERRPLAIKVSNLPRNNRPQWGLMQTDIVFEYYTEEGTTRFITLFYGRDAEIVGPIRSARFFDIHVVRGYKTVFAFGSAYEVELNRLFNSEFADRLVLEGPNSPLERYDPNGYNHLVVNTAKLSAYMTAKGIENGRQNLDGMFFKLDPPAGGQPVEHVFVRYSNAIYNRWDYDPTTGQYLRFSDVQNDASGGQNEVYAQLTDHLTGQPIAFDNVVVLFVTHEYYSQTPEIVDILFTGTGTAYAFRDGQVYQVVWQRIAPDAVVSLTYPDGTPFPFKPGTTWIEVVGASSQVEQTGQGWRFTHIMP